MNEYSIVSMSRSSIEAGDYALVIFDNKRKWLRQVIADKIFHCDKGYLEFNDIIGKQFGYYYRLSSQKKVAIINPIHTDIIFHMKRMSQIIYPEDIGLILTYGEIIPGKKVIEAGTGSGSLTGTMGRYVQNDGKVNTFEIRDIAHRQAEKNIKIMGVEKVVNCNLSNITEVYSNFSNIDFIMLDLPNTWEVVVMLKGCLSSEGRVCLFSPVIEQVKKNIKALKENSFKNIISLEMFRRTFQVKPNATRPRGRMVGHTGYLTFANLDENTPLISPLFSNHYTPENFGCLIQYLDLDLSSNLLIVGKDTEILQKLLNFQFNNLLNYKIMAPDDITKFLEENPNEKFSSILLDCVKEKNIVKQISKIMIPGGVIGAINKYIEGMKEINDQLILENFKNVESSEQIKRIIYNTPSGNYSQCPHSHSSGYLTFGRMIIDDLKDIVQKVSPIKEEYKELLMKVGDLSEDEEEKIDYANLRED